MDSLLANYLLSSQPSASKEAIEVIKKLVHVASQGHLCLHLKENECKAIEPLPQIGFILDSNRLYLQRNYDYETQVLKALKGLLSQSVSLENEEAIENYLSEKKDALLPAQKQAIKGSLSSSITLLIGGPGTGKTYTAAHLIDFCFKHTSFQLALAAPTGKAAQNLSKGLERFQTDKKLEVLTLHQLLKVREASGFFNQEEEPHLLGADLILVDEASMIDVRMMARLLSAIKPGARLVLIGDPAQLPPVEAGSIFADLTRYDGGRLTKPLAVSMRTNESELLHFAQLVKSGTWDEIEPLLFKPSDRIAFYELSDPFQAREKLLAKVEKKIKEVSKAETPLEAIEKLEKSVILISTKQGLLGVKELNQFLFEKLMYTKKGRYLPLIISRNDSRLGLVNGDVGVAEVSSLGINYSKVTFKKGQLELPLKVLPSFEWAFCLSIHKSQGSEYEEVSILLPEQTDRFTKELFYTALTRAKKKVEVLASLGVLKRLLSEEGTRFSGLLERLS